MATLIQFPGPARRRLKPRHLTRAKRLQIVSEFIACASSEEVASRLRLPLRCVDDVLKHAALRIPPQPERRLAMVAGRLA